MVISKHGLERIRAKEPIHLFLVGCLNPCLQGMSVHVVWPQPFDKKTM